MAKEYSVLFNINGIEIKTIGKAPSESSIPEDGLKNIAVINAISKIKSETGIDLNKIDEDISEKANIVLLK